MDTSIMPTLKYKINNTIKDIDLSTTRSTSPSLNVKYNGTTYYVGMIATTPSAGDLAVKYNGTTYKVGGGTSFKISLVNSKKVKVEVVNTLNKQFHAFIFLDTNSTGLVGLGYHKFTSSFDFDFSFFKKSYQNHTVMILDSDWKYIGEVVASTTPFTINSTDGTGFADINFQIQGSGYSYSNQTYKINFYVNNEIRAYVPVLNSYDIDGNQIAMFDMGCNIYYNNKFYYYHADGYGENSSSYGYFDYLGPRLVNSIYNYTNVPVRIAINKILGKSVSDFYGSCSVKYFYDSFGGSTIETSYYPNSFIVSYDADDGESFYYWLDLLSLSSSDLAAMF